MKLLSQNGGARLDRKARTGTVHGRGRYGTRRDRTGPHGTARNGPDRTASDGTRDTEHPTRDTGCGTRDTGQGTWDAALGLTARGGTGRDGT